MSADQNLPKIKDVAQFLAEHGDTVEHLLQDNFGPDALHHLRDGRLLVSEEAIRSEVSRLERTDGVLKELRCTPDGAMIVVEARRHGAAIQAKIRFQIQKLVITESLQTLVLSVTEQAFPVGRNILGKIACFMGGAFLGSLTGYALKNSDLDGYTDYDEEKKLLTVRLGTLRQVQRLLQPQVPSWKDSIPLRWLGVKGAVHVSEGIELKLKLPDFGRFIVDRAGKWLKTRSDEHPENCVQESSEIRGCFRAEPTGPQVPKIQPDCFQLCDGIWAGVYPDASIIGFLLERGVQTFVNLTRPDEKLFFGLRSYKDSLPKGIYYNKFPLYSYELPPVDELLPIVECLDAHPPSYLHCRQGLDRTGTVAVLALMKRGMTLRAALESIRKERDGMAKPSPRRRYHFRYLCNAELHMRGEASVDFFAAEKIILGEATRDKAGPLLTEVEVRDVESLKEAVKVEAERIAVKGPKAKRVHRAISGMNAVVKCGIMLGELDLRDAGKIMKVLIDAKVGPRKINAILNRVGTDLSYALSANYRELSYIEPDDSVGGDNGKCILALKD